MSDTPSLSLCLLRQYLIEKVVTVNVQVSLIFDVFLLVLPAGWVDAV